MRLKSKRLISLLLAGSMMVSMLPASAVTAFAETPATAVVAENSNTETSGDCGATESDSVHWNYASGVLSITGTGAMANFKMPTDTNPKAGAVARPWESLIDEITEVKISEGITSIGDNAFHGFTALTTANIPASISKLGDHIFRSDAALKNVTWAPGFQAPTETTDTDSTYQTYTGAYVPTSMFDGCTSLGEGVELSTWLPSSFKGIGCAAFRGTAFTIDFDSWSNLEYIGAYAFSEMPNLTHFTLTNKYKIGLRGKDSPISRAFFNSGLEELVVASDVTNIPHGFISGGNYKGTLQVSATGDLHMSGYGFSGNTTLRHAVIDVANNYTSDSGAFRNAKALETVVLKSTNATLDDRMFVECPKLKVVDFTQCGSITYDTTGYSFANTATTAYECSPLNSSVIFCVKNESQNPRNHNTGLSATHGIVFVVGDGDVDVNKEGFDSVSKPGYATRWYTDSACTTALTADEVKKGPQIGKTYYAAYKTLHTVTFDDGVNNSTVKVADGETVAKPETDPKKDGNKFDGWYTDKDCTAGKEFKFADNENANIITTNTTVYANWTPYKTKVEPKVEANADPASKTVEITVNVEAAPAELAGATATLNFTDANGHDDSANVVEVKVNGKTFNKNADGKYTADLSDLMNAGKVPDASENGAETAMLADVNAGAVVPGTVNGTARLTVTYKTPGKHNVGIVLNAANGDVICKEIATVEIAPEPGTLNLTGCTAKLEDGTPVENGAKVPVGAEVTVTFEPDADSDLVLNGWNVTPETLTDTNGKLVKDITAETFTFVMPETDEGVTIAAKTKTKAAAPAEDDSLDAATVVTGVVLGTGTAILAYHIGTEVYAEQVLGKGVAIPRTREEVALKAWELAGKPAVELNGEPLSEAAQAEKWAVESGLMQNVDGSFNGSKKMSKLKALRTLDAAKKLG